MFPNHVAQTETPFNHFYNNHIQAPYNQNNPGMYGRHTSPHLHQAPNNLIPPQQQGPPGGPPSMMPTWNGGFNMMPPHQQPYNPMQNIHHQNHPGPPPNLMNPPPNRHQFNPHPSPIGNPYQQPNMYGHHPTSQFMMPVPQFQGNAEMFHQGYVTAGGPFSAHQNEVFYHHPMTDHRQIPNFMGPPPPHFNQRPPMQTQQGFCPSPFPKPDLLSTSFVEQVCGQYGITIPLFRKGYSHPDDNFSKPFTDEDDKDLSQEIFQPPQSPQINEPCTTDVPKGVYSAKSPTRIDTSSDCILERNTAANFDESSDELAEIFGDKSSNNPGNSRASSKTSSMRTSSSGYIFYSDNENNDNTPAMDASMGSTKVSKDTPISQGGCMERQDSSSNDSKHTSQAPQTNMRPPPGFTQIKKTEGPSEEQLHKVGHIIKGLLKIDVKGMNEGQFPRTSPHEGNTIRSMIHQPIYSNCESRLMRQEPEVQENEKQSETVAVLNSADTGQKRYIQKITSHFRILFEPIPDMFADDLML